MFFHFINSHRVTVSSLFLCIQFLPFLSTSLVERSHLRARQVDHPKDKTQSQTVDLSKAVACTSWEVATNTARCNGKAVTQCGFANEKQVDTSNPSQLSGLSGVGTGCSSEQPYKAVLCNSYTQGSAGGTGSKPPVDPKSKKNPPQDQGQGQNQTFTCTEQDTKKSMTCTRINVPIKCLVEG